MIIRRALPLLAALCAPAAAWAADEPADLWAVLACGVPADNAESVLARAGVKVNGPPAANLGAMVYGVPVGGIEAAREGGALRIYYGIPVHASAQFIETASMEAVGNGDGYIRFLNHDRNALQAINPAFIVKRGGKVAPIVCEMQT